MAKRKVKVVRLSKADMQAATSRNPQALLAKRAAANPYFQARAERIYIGQLLESARRDRFSSKQEMRYGDPYNMVDESEDEYVEIEVDDDENEVEESSSKGSDSDLSLVLEAIKTMGDNMAKSIIEAIKPADPV